MKKNTSEQPTSKTPPVLGAPEFGKRKLNRWTIAIVVIGILVVGVLFSLIYYSTIQTSSKTFEYTPPRDSQGSYNSLTVSDVDGLVTVVPWSQSSILINGTITAMGLGSSLSAVTITNSSINGDVVFKAIFPVGAGILFSQTYTAAINVFVPSTIRFDSVHISNVNGGATLGKINSTSLIVTTVNGNISTDCVYCMTVNATSLNGNVTATFATLVAQGSYSLTATNADINFSVPSSSSFKLTADVLNGYIVCPICIGQSNNQKSFTETFNGGSASVNLGSLNGQIMITGT